MLAASAISASNTQSLFPLPPSEKIIRLQESAGTEQRLGSRVFCRYEERVATERKRWRYRSGRVRLAYVRDKQPRHCSP